MVRSLFRVRRLLRRGVLLATAISLAACGGPRPGQDTGATGDADKLQVVTTFLPITLFTRAVAGDCADVRALISPSTGPHDFQSKPGDLLTLKQARVLVKNGLEMESFLDKLVASAENESLVIVDSSAGVTTIAAAEREDHHDHGDVDPHIWLDPSRAVQQVETIRDGLVAADPACAEDYRKNAAAYTGQLRELDREIEAMLRPFAGQTFATFHDFAAYFADRYGLKPEFIVDVPGSNPSPEDLQRISTVVKRTQLQALLSEPQEGERSFNTLADDLGVTISEFDPLETGSEDDARDPATYSRVMRSNAENLRQAFGG
jgi:zinc/manganese transport system substrate-binding protein